MHLTDGGVDDGLAAGDDDAEVCRATSVISLAMRPRGCSVDALFNLDEFLGDLSGESGGDDDAPGSGADDGDSQPPDCLLRYVCMVLLWVIYLTFF